MILQSESLRCSDCGSIFAPEADEQACFRALGYDTVLKRCPSCRSGGLGSKRRGISLYASRRPMFAVVCARCGRGTAVPFKPSSAKAVYCSDCYSRARPGR